MQKGKSGTKHSKGLPQFVHSVGMTGIRHLYLKHVVVIAGLNAILYFHEILSACGIILDFPKTNPPFHPYMTILNGFIYGNVWWIVSAWFSRRNPENLRFCTKGFALYSLTILFICIFFTP